MLRVCVCVPHIHCKAVGCACGEGVRSWRGAETTPAYPGLTEHGRCQCLREDGWDAPGTQTWSGRECNGSQGEGPT